MALIQKRADEMGLSLNKTIKLLLREALGLSPVQADEKESTFQEFCGVWSDDEFEAFTQQMKDFDHIDPEDWK